MPETLLSYFLQDTRSTGPRGSASLATATLLLSPAFPKLTLPGRLERCPRVQALPSNCLVLDPSSIPEKLIRASDSVSVFHL